MSILSPVTSVPKLPDDLSGLPQWVLWRYEKRNGKPTKVPYQVDGKRAKSDDPRTWNTFESVIDVSMKAPVRYSGIGFVFAASDPFTGIDLDNCVEQTGAFKAWAQPILEKFADTYMEISPSGRGVKIWVRAHLKGCGRRAPYNDGAVEIYDRGRFFTTTGKIAQGAPLVVAAHQSDVSELYDLVSKRCCLRGRKADLRHQSLVPEGERYNYLQSAAAQFRAKGMDREEIYSALVAINQRRCRPPKPVSVVRELAQWAGVKLEPGRRTMMLSPDLSHEQLSRREPPNLLCQLPNDHGNAERVIAMYGDDLRYCHALRNWFVFDGRRWAIDGSEQSRRCTKKTMLELLRQAAEANNDELERFARASLDSKRITNALREAQDSLSISPTLLDTHPFLLNVLNGTVDVCTGQLSPHSRGNYITKLVHHNYSPGAKAPTFEAFLARIMGAGPDASAGQNERADRLIGYLQKAFGYSLTGVTSAKVVFLLHGAGDNGKSTLLSTFLELLAEYAVLLQIDTLMTRQESNNTQADLADLRGARFVMTSETEEGQRLAEGKLKRITQGMGRIKATRKYENPIEFNESHKLWIDANHLPHVRGTDNAIWNRLHPIPFDVVIPKPEQDQHLRDKLLNEAEGILAWAIRGAMRWRLEGLGKPPEVEQAGAVWRSDSDQTGRFIAACCVRVEAARGRAAELYQAYRKWAEDGGERSMNEMDFSRRLVEQGFPKKHDDRGNYYGGLGLRAQAEGLKGTE